MTENRIKLEKKNFERLSQLIKDKELKHEAAAWSEDLLFQEELDLQIRINNVTKNLSKPKEIDARQDEQMQKSWQTLQKIIKKQSFEQTWSTIESKYLMPMKPLTKKWLASPKWWSMAAVATFAGLIIFSRGNELSRSSENDLMVSKGSSEYSANQCNVDIMNPNGQSLSLSPDGLGYIAPISSTFQLSMNCNTSGYLQIEAVSAETRSLRNLAIKSDQTTRFNGDKASFKLTAENAWTIRIMLTRDQVEETLPIDKRAQRGDLWGSTPILWLDTLQVRQSPQ